MDRETYLRSKRIIEPKPSAFLVSLTVTATTDDTAQNLKRLIRGVLRKAGISERDVQTLTVTPKGA
jgi:hypothetical protein